MNTLHDNHRGQHLWRGDNDNSIQWQRLHDRHRCIGSARGKINQQEIECSPIDIAIELFNSTGDHRPTPDDGITFLFKEHVHRHDLDTALTPQWLNRRAIFRSCWLSPRTKHTCDAWPGNIPIQNTNLQALSTKRYRE